MSRPVSTGYCPACGEAVPPYVPGRGLPSVYCGGRCYRRVRAQRRCAREGHVESPPPPTVEEWLADRRPAWAREPEPRPDAWAGYSSLGEVTL